jgi:hypothetical protein
MIWHKIIYSGASCDLRFKGNPSTTLMAFMKEKEALIQLAAVLYISNCWFATHGK